MSDGGWKYIKCHQLSSVGACLICVWQEMCSRSVRVKCKLEAELRKEKLCHNFVTEPSLWTAESKFRHVPTSQVGFGRPTWRFFPSNFSWSYFSKLLLWLCDYRLADLVRGRWIVASTFGSWRCCRVALWGRHVLLHRMAFSWLGWSNLQIISLGSDELHGWLDTLELTTSCA